MDSSCGKMNIYVAWTASGAAAGRDDSLSEAFQVPLIALADKGEQASASLVKLWSSQI